MLGALISFGVDAFSSVLRIVGGIICVSLPIQLPGYPAHVAAATWHFMLAFMALMGTGMHLIAGELTKGLSQAVLLGAQIGARLVQRVHGRWILRRLAVGNLTVGARLIGGAIAFRLPLTTAGHPVGFLVRYS